MDRLHLEISADRFGVPFLRDFTVAFESKAGAAGSEGCDSRGTLPAPLMEAGHLREAAAERKCHLGLCGRKCW